MSEKMSQFSKTEKIVISLAAVLLIGGVLIWVTDFPIGKYVLGLTGGSSQNEVGKLERTSGNIRREQATETDFQDISANTSLFNEDTLVTAPEDQRDFAPERRQLDRDGAGNYDSIEFRRQPGAGRSESHRERRSRQR